VGVDLAERDETSGAWRVRVEDPLEHLSRDSKGGPRLFSVRGLTAVITAETAAGGEPAPVTRRLNYRREVLRERGIRVLFWIEPETIAYLSQNAPDFWAFRSGTAMFVRRERPTGESLLERQPVEQPLRSTAVDLEEKLAQLAVYQSKSPPDLNAVANLRLEIGKAYFQRFELQRALESLHESLRLFEQLGLPNRVRDVKIWLARAFERTGQLGPAEGCLRAAIEIDERLGNEPNLAIDYSNLSQLYQARGELAEAEGWLRRAIEIDERLGNEPNLTIDYNNLSGIYEARGDHAEAATWRRKAEEMRRAIGERTT